MQLIATITALFAGAALAAPQWGYPPPPPGPIYPQPYPYPYPYNPPPSAGPYFPPYNQPYYPPYYPPYNPPVVPGIRPGQGGNGDGAYHGGCSCAVGGNFNNDIGRLACDNLSASYPNLHWDAFNLACVDSLGAGVEQHGYTKACQEVAKQVLPTAFGFDFTSFVTGQCTVR